MFGPDILVTPVLDEADEHVIEAYIPPSYGGNEGWYELWSGAEQNDMGVTQLETTIYQISAHLKAGCIIPTLVSLLSELCLTKVAYLKYNIYN